MRYHGSMRGSNLHDGDRILYGSRDPLPLRHLSFSEDWRDHPITIDRDQLGIGADSAFKGWSSTPAGGDYWCGTEDWAVDLNFSDGGDFPAEWIKPGEENFTVTSFAGIPPDHIRAWVEAGRRRLRLGIKCDLRLHAPDMRISGADQSLEEGSLADARYDIHNPRVDGRITGPSRSEKVLFQVPAVFLQAVEKMHGRGPLNWRILSDLGALMGYDQHDLLQGLVRPLPAHPPEQS